MNELYPEPRTRVFIDLDGNEWYKAEQKSPLLEATPEEEVYFSSDARPAMTAWKGADMNAFYFENGQWLHCQTNQKWNG